MDEVLDDSKHENQALRGRARRQAEIIERTLAGLGYAAQVRNIHHGPRFTQFSLRPSFREQISNIVKVEPDLAVALSGALAEIEEPVPGYPYLTLLVENHRSPEVKLRRVLESPLFQQKQGGLKIALGLDTFGEAAAADLAAMPHLLIGGATGSGKSVCLRAITAGLLCTYNPDALRLLVIDPTGVELKSYSSLPHLVGPVVARSDRVLEALNSTLTEIERRYRLFAEIRVRDITAYHRQASQPLPYLIIIMDNLLDLMLNAPKELEQAMSRIAQRGRAAGIHMVLSSQRTNVSALSGSIKANFPGRIAFSVTDRAESQLILDSAGAEKLLGQGDMLFKSPAAARLQRIQGVFVSPSEIRRIADFWRGQGQG